MSFYIENRLQSCYNININHVQLFSRHFPTECREQMSKNDSNLYFVAHNLVFDDDQNAYMTSFQVS